MCTGTRAKLPRARRYLQQRLSSMHHRSARAQEQEPRAQRGDDVVDPVEDSGERGADYGMPLVNECPLQCASATRVHTRMGDVRSVAGHQVMHSFVPLHIINAASSIALPVNRPAAQRRSAKSPR